MHSRTRALVQARTHRVTALHAPHCTRAPHACTRAPPHQLGFPPPQGLIACTLASTQELRAQPQAAAAAAAAAAACAPAPPRPFPLDKLQGFGAKKIALYKAKSITTVEQLGGNLMQIWNQI